MKEFAAAFPDAKDSLTFRTVRRLDRSSVEPLTLMPFDGHNREVHAGPPSLLSR